MPVWELCYGDHWPLGGRCRRKRGGHLFKSGARSRPPDGLSRGDGRKGSFKVQDRVSETGEAHYVPITPYSSVLACSQARGAGAMGRRGRGGVGGASTGRVKGRLMSTPKTSSAGRSEAPRLLLPVCSLCCRGNCYTPPHPLLFFHDG